MLYNSNDSNNLPIPVSVRTPEEMIRIYPLLVSALHQMNSRIALLENKIKSLETIGGNGNQV